MVGARPHRARRRLLALGLAALVIVSDGSRAAATADAGEYRFRSAGVATPVAVGAAVLTDEERAFVAALPEIRVAVPLPPARPYEIVDGHEVSGIHPEMLQAMARTFGLRLRPVVLPSWSAVLEAAQRREVDLLMTLGVTADRLEYLEYTLGATPLPGALFARADSDGQDLTRARFAVERDYLVNEVIRRQYPQATIVTVDTTPDALRAVAERRADYYLGSLLEATDWLTREPVAGIEIRRLHPFGTGHYHFAVRKDWAPLAGILNKGVQSLRGEPSASLQAALAAASGVSLPPPLALPAAERQALVRKAVWRVGAVRGLSLLNDVDARGVHAGIAAEYTEQVAQRLGIATQVVPFASVSDMLDALRGGAIDVVPFLTRTPEREREFAYSAPYVEMPYVLVARNDTPMYWGLDSLRGRRLALAARHPLRDVLAREAPEIRIVDADNGTHAMNLVAAGDADAAVEVKLFANLRINDDPYGHLRALGEVDALPAQFHFAAARAQAALIAPVDRALADIPASERERMLRRWVALDLEPRFHWQRHLPELAIAGGAALLLAAATAWWMSRLSGEVRRRRRSEALLNDIATTVPGVAFRYVLNADGSIRHHFFTPGAKAFFGVDLDPQRTVLESLATRLRPEQLAEASAAQDLSMRTGEPFKITVAYDHPDGRERWLHAEAVQTRSGGHGPVWTGYVVDVTPERELQARLAREAEARNLMLASASHELRAPTHTLTLALQSVPAEGLTPDQQAALRIARDAGRTLTQLLNDVLEAARADVDPLNLRPQTVVLRPLLGDIAAAWRAAARTKGLAFAYRVGDEVPAMAVLDPLRLKQILTNLLSNASKYTSAGEVALEVSMAGPERLRLEVRDTGVGISADERERLFRPFATAGDAAPVPEGRTGLGLTICARLVELMGGRIALDSAPGRGTTARVELPLHSMPDAAPGSWPEHGRVLVCDDDATSRLLMTQMLRRIGFDVVDTGEAAHALELWRRGGVRAVVSDLDMPGMSGMEMLAAIRREEAGRTPRTAVIVCSGSLVPTEAGADEPYDAYLVKPVQVETLAETLSALGLRH